MRRLKMKKNIHDKRTQKDQQQNDKKTSPILKIVSNIILI